MWQPHLQLLYRQVKAHFISFQENSLVLLESVMRTADPESTKIRNLY